MKQKKTLIAAVALVLVAVCITAFAIASPGGKRAASHTPANSPAAANHAGRFASPSLLPTLAESLSDWSYEAEPTHTQAQYDLLISTLKFKDYEKMSIAEFNRKLNALFNDRKSSGDVDQLNSAYGAVISSLAENDPNAGFLLNTVRASLDEYSSRYEEVCFDRQVSPSFNGRAMCFREQAVDGETYRTDYAQAEYEFTYRILDQDKLTVAARDRFLQDVLAGAQAYLDSKTPGQLIDDPDGEGSFRTALEAAGKAVSNTNIEFINCEVTYYDVFR